MYENADYISSALLLSLLIVEKTIGVSVLSLILLEAGNRIQQQAACAFLLVKLMPGIVMFILSKPLRAISARLAPPSRVEALTRLSFVQENALEDPHTALHLTADESNRIMSRLPAYLQPLRTEASEND